MADYNDPANGPNGYGQYRDFHSWGGRGDQWADDGHGGHVRIGGTSAFDQDIARDKAMGDNVNPAAARIDRTSTDQSHNMAMGALGLMSARANGADTPAQALSRQQTQGAVSALNSSAASIKGGAMAREAAARGAVAGGARVAAQGAQDTQALAAREQADAAGQLYTGAAAQRGNDIGLASSQAQLQAQQNALNESHDAFYNQQQFNTQKAQVDASLGRSAADIAATNASAATNLQEQQANLNNYKAAASTALAGVSGAFSVAGSGPGRPSGPESATSSSDPDDPWTHSDERTKQNVEPMTAKARVAANARDLALSDEASKKEVAAIARREGQRNGFQAGVNHSDAIASGGAPTVPEYMPHGPVPGGARALEIAHPQTAAGKETSYPIAPAQAPEKPAKPAKTPHVGRPRAEADPMANANRAMVASSYEYKPQFTPGTQAQGETNVGPMANAMASDPVASTAIVRDPHTGLLAIDKEKGLKLTMGGLASLQQQIDQMKGNA